VPDDIKALAEPVMSHRLLLTAEAEFAGVRTSDVIGRILGEVAPPTERVA
jgi:MoxR-like ATPase